MALDDDRDNLKQRIAEHREKAEWLRKFAAKMPDAHFRSSLLNMAAEYDKLADE
jgi:hypothetical protein